MFRLTEPSVKSHPYFTNVDWATVAKGDYQDPFQLEIDPVAEYNTQFFPRLCLEETPTVDMSGHDYGKDSENEQNALNNDEIYATLQKQFARELETFEWSCQGMYDLEEDSIDDATTQNEEPMDQADVEDVDGPIDDEGSVSPMEEPTQEELLNSSLQEPAAEPQDEPMEEAITVSPSIDTVSDMRDVSTPDISHDTPSVPQEASQDDLERVETPEERQLSDLHAELDAIAEIKDAESAPQTPSAVDEVLPDAVESVAAKTPSIRPESMARSPSALGEAAPSPVPSKAAAAKAPSVRSQASSSAATTAPSIATRPASVATRPSSIATRPSSIATHPPSKASTTGTKAASIDTKVVSPPVSPKAPSVVLPPPSDPSTSPVHNMNQLPVPTVEVGAVEEMDAEFAMGPDASPTSGQMPRLPSGPPLSGLSVSDMISIPSHQGSQNLIIRRHRNLPSIDSYRHAARLSVDLNGTFGQLGDEDWEQLDADAIPELPNGANESGRASLFARGLGNMLGRRPTGSRIRRSSTFMAPSSLRKPASTEASDTSSDRSPSKTRQPLFATRGIENTRKAFTKIKAFPAPASRNESLRPSAANSVSPSPVSSIRGMPPPPLPTGSGKSSRAVSGARAVSMRDNQNLSPDDATIRRSSMIAALTPGSKRSNIRSNDIQSLFSRPRNRRQRPVDRSGATSRSSIESSTTAESTSGTTSPPPALSSAPRVELNPTPPIAWGQVLGKDE